MENVIDVNHTVSDYISTHLTGNGGNNFLELVATPSKGIFRGHIVGYFLAFRYALPVEKKTNSPVAGHYELCHTLVLAQMGMDTKVFVHDGHIGRSAGGGGGDGQIEGMGCLGAPSSTRTRGTRHHPHESKHHPPPSRNTDQLI